MPKRFILFVIAALLFFVESIILSGFSWYEVSLPLTFAFGLAWAVVGDEWDAIFLGLLTGFYADMYTTQLFGINMLLNMLIFLGIHFGKKYLRHEKNWIMIICMGLAAFIRYGLHFALNLATGLTQDFKRVAVLALMVMILAVILLPLSRLLQKRFKKARRR